MFRKNDSIKAALELKKKNLEEKKRLHNSQLNSIYEQNSELQNIDRELAAKGASIALTALSGDLAELERLQNQITELSSKKKAIINATPISEIKYDCEKCQDTGYIGGKICSCVKELAKRITFEHLSKEMPLLECNFNNFNLNYYPNVTGDDGINPYIKMTTMLKLCRDYAADFSLEAPSLLFLGGVGLGKTHLTLAIVSEIIEKGYDVIYGSAYNLLSAVEKEHFSKEDGESYEAMLEADLLVIDDLGTEFTSPYTLSVLYNLINSRLLSKKPTIINTNLTFPEIEKRYTPRIASRLIGCYTVKKFSGPDIRQLKIMNKQ